MACVEDPRERAAAQLRRKEQYRAAVSLSVAITAALMGTAWAGGSRIDAALPDSDYSEAHKSANIAWKVETLDKWLTNTQAVAPGARTSFRLENPPDGKNLIAYLKERPA